MCLFGEKIERTLKLAYVICPNVESFVRKFLTLFLSGAYDSPVNVPHIVWFAKIILAPTSLATSKRYRVKPCRVVDTL
jgi:hypothetical protein